MSTPEPRPYDPEAPSPIQHALARLVNDQTMSAEECGLAVGQIVDGRANEPEIAAFLTATQIAGVTVDSLVGAARAVLDRMTPFDIGASVRPVVDTCGTGGDGACTLNVSTATAIVAAACGLRVAKHGNRSASGRVGSAEVLTALGVDIEPDPRTAHASIESLGITFLFAPRYHPALKHAAPVRKRLPFRTLFNLVGPLVNPSRPEFQLIGAPGPEAAGLMARAVAALGIRRAAVVSGENGLDEVTPFGVTKVWWVENGGVRQEAWQPADFKFDTPTRPLSRVETPEAAAAALRAVLAGERNADRALVVANAAAALFVARMVASLAEGVAVASQAIDDHAASALLDRWITQRRNPVAAG